MAELTIKHETREDDGTLFERSDGEVFLLSHLSADGSASFGPYPSRHTEDLISFGLSIADKLEYARCYVVTYPHKP